MRFIGNSSLFVSLAVVLFLAYRNTWRSDWSLRIEALCRCSFGDDGVVQVTKGKIRTGPISFTKEDPNRNWSGPIIRTGLAHKLGISHFIQTGRTQKNGDMSN